MRAESMAEVAVPPEERRRWLFAWLRHRVFASGIPIAAGALAGLAGAFFAFRDHPLAYLMLFFAGALGGYAVFFLAASYERLLDMKKALEEEQSRGHYAHRSRGEE
jgi:hypothetical protein